MANLLVDIIAYLKAQGAVTGGDGVDCFRDYTPPTPDSLVSLYEYTIGGSQMGVSCIPRGVQIRARATTYSAARTTLMSIYSLLDRPLDPIVNLTSTRWAVIQGASPPTKLMEDENRRITFSCNLHVTTYKD